MILLMHTDVVAVAEQAAALRTAAYFRVRAERADLAEFDRILAKAGTEAPRSGDELPGEAAGRSADCEYDYDNDNDNDGKRRSRRPSC